MRRLIEDAPEGAQIADGVDEIAEIHRLDHVGVDAQLIALEEVAVFAGGSEHHYRDRSQMFI